MEGDASLPRELRRFFPEDPAGERDGVVLNLAHGSRGDAGATHAPAMLEVFGLAYSGPTPLGHAMTFDRVASKVLMRQAGVPTPVFHLVPTNRPEQADLTYPAVVDAAPRPRFEARDRVGSEAAARRGADAAARRREGGVRRGIRRRQIHRGVAARQRPDRMPAAGRGGRGRREDLPGAGRHADGRAHSRTRARGLPGVRVPGLRTRGHPPGREGRAVGVGGPDARDPRGSGNVRARRVASRLLVPGSDGSHRRGDAGTCPRGGPAAGRRANPPRGPSSIPTRSVRDDSRRRMGRAAAADRRASGTPEARSLGPAALEARGRARAVVGVRLLLPLRAHPPVPGTERHPDRRGCGLPVHLRLARPQTQSPSRPVPAPDSAGRGGGPALPGARERLQSRPLGAHSADRR